MNQSQTASLTAMLAVLNGFAQQPSTALTFKPLVSTGMTIGGHTLTRDTAVDGIAFNDSGEVAFVTRWNESGRERTAVMTSKRMIAQDGDTVDGKFLTRVLPASLRINTGGVTAYEAIYGNPSQTGVFTDRKHIVTLSTAGADNDFALTEDGKIVLQAAVAVAPATTATPKQRKAWLPPGLAARLPAILNTEINGNPKAPIYIDPRMPAQYPQNRPQQQTKPAAPSPVSKGAVPAAHPCPAPEWPMPTSWSVGDSLIGPITSHLVEGPPKTKPYDSKIFGRMIAPIRTVQFSADCKALTIGISDLVEQGQFELHSPAGLITYAKSDGYLALPGFSGKVAPAILMRSDTPILINKRGQLLIPTSFDKDDFAILLGTPTRGTR